MPYDEKNNIIQNIIESLVSGNENYDKFSGLSLIGSNEKENYSQQLSNFWNQLVLYMRDKGGTRESSFNPDTETIVKYINNNIDFDYGKPGSFLDNFLKVKFNEEGEEQFHHWNESLDKIIKFYYNKIENDNADLAISVKGVKDADAGYSYNNGKWVVPWENVNEINYSEARGSDKIKLILNNSKYLQHTLHVVVGMNGERLPDQYLRLIMPEYQRSVEIEDLNRNFWVIGQTLAGLCAYLLGDDNPLDQILPALLDEIAQLWENIFYLWLYISLINMDDQEEEEIQTLFVPINSAATPWVDYNLYNAQITQQSINTYSAKRLLEIIWSQDFYYLERLYKRSSIVVIPEIRLNNYEYNYYSKAVYLGTIFYNIRKPENNRVLAVPFKEPIVINAHSIGAR